MKIRRKNIKISITNIVGYLLVLWILLGSNTVYSTSSTTDYKLTEITTVLLFAYLLLKIRYLKHSVWRNWLMLFIPYAILNVVVLINSVSSEKLIAYIVRFLVFIPILCLIFQIDYSRGSRKDFLILYKDFVTLYAVITLVLWFAICVIGISFPSRMVTYDWGTTRNTPVYLGVLNVRQSQMLFGRMWTRNMGFFTEGPMYNLVILIAIAIEVFYSPVKSNNKVKSFLDGVNLKKLIILTITDITTFTISGFIILVFIIALRYVLIRSNTALKTFIKWLGLLFVLLIAVYLVNFFFSLKVNTGSWEVRADDFLAGVKAWNENIWFGTGYDSMDAINRHMSSYRFYNTGYSSGLFSILAQGGVAFFAIYLIGFIGYIKKAVISREFGFISLLIVMVLVLINFICQNSFVFLSVVSFGYSLFAIDKSYSYSRKGS